MQWTQSNLFEEGFIAMLPTDLYNGADIPFNASAAIAMLLAYSAKVRPDQIGESDTTDQCQETG